MYRYFGDTRQTIHIAVFLTFIAGLVNIVGLLSIHILTTNVTGHFAFLVEESSTIDLYKSVIYFIFIFSFFLGAFIANFVIEFHFKKSERPILVVPVIIESVMLIMISLIGEELKCNHPDWLACTLLFTMGLQNALATRLTNSIVRTTHLTGIFTDLGMECAQLFHKERERPHRIKFLIKIKLIVIASFFLGGILGAFYYSMIGFKILLLGSVILLLGLVYDNFNKIGFILKEE